MVVAEIKYSVCPRPFKRPREARRLRDGHGTVMGWDGEQGRCKEQVRELYRLLKSFLVGGG